QKQQDELHPAPMAANKFEHGIPVAALRGCPPRAARKRIKKGEVDSPYSHTGYYRISGRILAFLIHMGA
ncbi:MAG: hypothetical protein ACN6PB_24855, partial [Achromobacter kerstersii]|uniref:hypothetical protein n=1 Tax=Achromobacter kerstersii TaxID=1353890 RepID=UPI003CFF94AE